MTGTQNQKSIRRPDPASSHVCIKKQDNHEEVRAEVETPTQETMHLQQLVSQISGSLGRLFDKLQSIAMGRGTALDYVSQESQAVVNDLNELDNEEYAL